MYKPAILLTLASTLAFVTAAGAQQAPQGLQMNMIALIFPLLMPPVPDVTPIPDRIAAIKARLKPRGIYLKNGKTVYIRTECDLNKLLGIPCEGAK